MAISVRCRRQYCEGRAIWACHYFGDVRPLQPMKRVSGPRRIQLYMHLRTVERRASRRREVMAARQGTAPLPVPSDARSQFVRAPSHAVAVPVPPVFSVTGQMAGDFVKWVSERDRTLTRGLRTAARRKARGKAPKRSRGHSFSDFRGILSITPAAALVVAAHYDRQRQLTDHKIKVYEYQDWQPQVRAVLEQVGFFDILDVPGAARPKDTGGARTMRIARYESGAKLRQERLSLMVQQLLDYMLIADPECLSGNDRFLRSAQMWEALVEATENTRRHAYPDDYQESGVVLPNWWLTGSADPEERKLTLVVYDLGVSIPGSLASHRPSQWAGHGKVNRAMRRFFKGEYDENDPASDHAKVRLAAKYGYSSTDELHRGKGLPVVRDAIRHCRRGRLHILSRFGEYVEESGSKPISRMLDHPMPGTLIVWELWL